MTAKRQLVAIMFTDIEGFTAMMQADEELALATRARYVDVLTEQHEAFGGTIVQYFGDGSLSIFPNSVDAVACAVAAQQAFRTPLEVPVRVGVHTGNVIVEPNGIIGDAVNIASRIESFGFPGAVMISDSVQDQVKNQTAFDFVDLGKFRLKNVGRPFSIFAVDTDGLVVPAPSALHGKGGQLASLPANLPDPPSALVGREDDLVALTDLVKRYRVVTIAGPGGIGKTSTAIEVCRRLLPEFRDGTSFIAMADVSHVSGFIPAIAAVLDVKEAEGRSLSDGITALIGDKEALLCVDNVEQVIDAAPSLAGLIAACPHLRMVVTSRAPLRIAGEYEYRLEPLAVPSHPNETDLEKLRKYPAIELFVNRAKSVNADFELTPENAMAVTEVCRRMDGLPLAIELAAARIRILTPEALLGRLEHALDVLTGGRRDVPDRHKTLRAAINWSHSLLSDAGRQLLSRMSVFASGATIDDIEAVCSDEQRDVIVELESLVDSALVAVAADRFSMLQTVREFAAEHLSDSGELEEITSRFADHYAALAGRIGAGVEGTKQLAWMERGEAEESNVHAALNHLARQANAGDTNACERGMTANGDLWIYWHIRGKHVSALDHSIRFLEASTERTRGRGKALNTAGISCLTLGRNEEAFAHLTEAFGIAEELGDAHTQHAAAVSLAVINMFTDLGSSKSWARQSITKLRELDYPFLLSLMLSFDGVFHAISDEGEVATHRLEEALAIQQERGDQEGAGISLAGLAMLANGQGQTDTALDLYARSLAAYEMVGDRAEEARVLDEMAWSYMAHGDHEAARTTFIESARAYEDIGSVRGIGISLIGLAAVKTVDGQHRDAMTIAFAAERFSQEEGVVNVYSEDNPGRLYLDRATDALSAGGIDRARTDGQTLTLKEALRMGHRTDVNAESAGTSI
jgi:predicted ATPase/class 3 adenylate cyclase